jgi:hypothetical protein
MLLPRDDKLIFRGLLDARLRDIPRGKGCHWFYGSLTRLSGSTMLLLLSRIIRWTPGGAIVEWGVLGRVLPIKDDSRLILKLWESSKVYIFKDWGAASNMHLCSRHWPLKSGLSTSATTIACFSLFFDLCFWWNDIILSLIEVKSLTDSSFFLIVLMLHIYARLIVISCGHSNLRRQEMPWVIWHRLFLGCEIKDLFRWRSKLLHRVLLHSADLNSFFLLLRI